MNRPCSCPQLPRSPRAPGRVSLAWLLPVFLGLPAGLAKAEPYRASGSNSPTASNLPRTLPASGYVTPEASGVQPARLFRNHGVAFNNSVALPPVSPVVRTESAAAGATVNLPSLYYNFPLLQRGFEPQNADLKVGPFYFKLQAVSGAVLWSDNINLSENKRESGVIAITRISGAVVAQVTESLRLSLAGSFVYLPLTNEAGFTGFGLYAPFIFGLEDPSFRSQASWMATIGDWNVVFADDFTIGLARFSNSFRDDAVLFAGGGFDAVDRAGRYTFAAGGQRITDHDRQDFAVNDTDIVYFSNIISAQTDRLVVGKTRLRVQAAHENLWYNQGNRGLPSIRDHVNVSLVSERENLRFKPFVMYSAFRTDTEKSFGQTLRAGIDGPITEHLHLHTEVGYYFGSNQDAILWQLNLEHQAGPYTQESLYYRRYISPFYDQLNEVLGYNIRQILGPKIVANAFIYRNRAEWLGAQDFSQTQYVTGLALRIRAGPRTECTLVGTGAQVDSEIGDYTTLTGLAEVSHFFTDTFVARLLYQHQQRDSDFRNNNYYENMVYFSLTKYFQ